MALTRRVITRAEWGARYANGWGARPLPVPQRFLHHSVTIAPDLVAPFDDDYAAVRAIEQIGQDRFGKGMSYTALFTPSGLIFEGLGIDRVGSHTADNNSAGAGLCLVGNYENDQPTRAQLDSVAWWLRYHRDHGWLTDATITAPHSAVYATACPGRYARDSIGYVNATALSEANLDTIDEGDDMATAKEVWDYKITNPADGFKAEAWQWLFGAARDANLVVHAVAGVPDDVWGHLLPGDPRPGGSPFSAEARSWLVDRARDSARLERLETAVAAIAAALDVELPEPSA